MCGLAAFFASSPDPAVPAWMDAAIELAAHRGPDGRGRVVGAGDRVEDSIDGPVDWALGHARLAILGLGEQGDQPMPSLDGSCWLVFNGEIYNFIELREELRGLGQEIYGDTDTEVVLAAWAEWGPACVERFNGMFAMVLVDTSNRTVFAARDRLGIKPLYIWSGSSGTALVSEPKQLRAFPDFTARANLQLVQDFLVDGVVGHEADATFFDGVVPVPPGHHLQWSLGERPDPSRARRWWTPSDVVEPMSWDEAVQRVRAQLIRSVELRMRSDVPVGSCLSGGVDSSSIVSIVTRLLGGSLQTFSSCSNDPAFDEQRWIDIVNEATGSMPVKVFPSESEAIELLDTIAWHQDEPFTSLSLYAQWCVMRAARAAAVPVLLDGQGGDETFCGYRKFAFFHLRQLLSSGRMLAGLRHAGAMGLHGDRRLFDLRAGARYLPGPFRSRMRPLIVLRESMQPLARHPWSHRMGGVRDLQSHRIADLTAWSLPSLLRYEDRTSMAHAIEARVPFVDHELIELGLRIPPAHLFRGGRGKAALLESMTGVLPEAIQNRRTKMGFESPQSVWMRGALGAEIERRIRASDAVGRWIDVEPLLDDDAVGPRDWNRVQATRFRVASLATWIDRFDVVT